MTGEVLRYPHAAGFEVRYRPEAPDAYGSWYLDEVGFVVSDALMQPDPLGPNWSAPRSFWDPPLVPKPDVSFCQPWPVLHNERGDLVLRELLEPWGEWLAMGGEAEGWSLWHCTTRTEVNEVRSRRTLGSGGADTGRGHIDVVVLDEGSWVPESVSMVLTVGLVWFEADAREPSGLRKHVIESGLSGIGLVKCWDPSETFCHDAGRYARGEAAVPWEGGGE